ncbi:MAG: hypothetical protein LBT86_07385 [Deltaproteobacteria bacterium]|nr:hypothetical protein [Deltaproteobacteria bacterium]
MSVDTAMGAIWSHALKILALGLALLVVWGTFSLVAWAKPPEGKNKPDSPSFAQVGDLTVQLVAPSDLVQVDGLVPAADAFVEAMKERFKLRVLGLYAEPEAFQFFAEGMANQRGRQIPRLALISVPTRMDKKKYDLKAVNKEKSRYREWFSLAVNTRPLAWIFGRKANTKLKEKLGVNLDFSYQTGDETGRFDERDRSLSFTVLTNMTPYSFKSEVLIAASVLNIGDKLVFLSWMEPFKGPESLIKAKSANLGWLFELARLNDVELKPVVENE